MGKTTVPQFMQINESMAQAHTLDKKEVWESEAEILKRFGEAEFKAHVASGRIAWREDPWTYDVYNYHDRGNMSKSAKVRKEKTYTRGQEYEAKEEDNDEWDGLWHLDAASHLQQVERWGKGKALTKGKGDPKGKGKGNQLALEDGSLGDDTDKEKEEEKDEETQWKELLGKTKKPETNAQLQRQTVKLPWKRLTKPQECQRQAERRQRGCCRICRQRWMPSKTCWPIKTKA